MMEGLATDPRITEIYLGFLFAQRLHSNYYANQIVVTLAVEDIFH